MTGPRGAGKPPEVKEAFRITGVRGFSPSGTFEQDDMDNWQGCSQAGRGVVARRHPLNLQMGLGHESYNEDLMGWTSDYLYGETNQRGGYQRWAQLMAANSWSEI